MEAELLEMSSKLSIREQALQWDSGHVSGVLISTIPVEWEAILLPDGGLVSGSIVHSSEHFNRCSPVFSSSTSVIWCGVKTSETETQTWPWPVIPLTMGLPPCNKIWWTVSNFLLRRARCNRSARCSDAGSPVVLQCTYLVCAWSGNPTKWLCCITARDTRPDHKHGHMTAWK